MATDQSTGSPLSSDAAIPPETADRSPFSLLRNGSLLAVSVGHGMVDLCANILPVFYPLLASALSLSYGPVSALLGVQTTATSLSQPFFGWLADRVGSRAVACLSVLGASLGVALMGYAPGYVALLMSVSLLGMGVGAYHPQGASSAAILGGRWRTTGVSVYMLFGSLGYSLGPLLGASLLVPAGSRSTALLLIPGLMVVLLLLATMGRVDRIVMKNRERTQGSPLVPVLWMGVLALACVTVARMWVNYGLITFVPLLYAARGETPQLAGEILFLVLFAEGIGSAVGGWLADTVGRRAVLSASFATLAPVMHLLLAADGHSAGPLALAAGLLLGCSATIVLVAAQELLPSRMGMASGIAISVGNIGGGVAVAGQGSLADRIGLVPSMEILVGVAVVAAVVSLGMGRERGDAGKG